MCFSAVIAANPSGAAASSNHIQVSGQHLGEAWMILALGDRVFGGDRAKRFEPYGLFNVQPVWQNVLKPLLLPDGEFLLALVQAGDRFRYTPAGEYNQRSVAIDRFLPVGDWNALQLVPAIDASSTRRIAAQFSVVIEGEEMRVTLQDGADGVRYRVVGRLGPMGASHQGIQATLVEGKTESNYPIHLLHDAKPQTFSVLEAPQGGGPTPESPVVIGIQSPDAAKPDAVLKIIPRPNYGPRDVELLAFADGRWTSRARIEMNSTPATIPLGNEGRWRLCITSTREHKKRNVQIAELKILFGEDAKKEDKKPTGVPAALTSVRVERIP